MIKRYCSNKGFSLLEIIVAISIMAILLGIGIPFFLRGKARQQLKVSARELKSNLDLARAMAKSIGRESTDSGTDVEVSFLGSGSDKTGYEIKDNNGRVRTAVTFTNGVKADISGITTPLQYKGNGSITTSGNIVVSSSNVKDSWTITLVSTTGLSKLKKN